MHTSSLPYVVQPSLFGREVAHHLGDDLGGEVGEHLALLPPEDERQHLRKKKKVNKGNGNDGSEKTKTWQRGLHIGLGLGKSHWVR